MGMVRNSSTHILVVTVNLWSGAHSFEPFPQQRARHPLPVTAQGFVAEFQIWLADAEGNERWLANTSDPSALSYTIPNDSWCLKHCSGFVEVNEIP